MVKQCKICTENFDFFPTCSTQKGSHKARGFCSKSCYEISDIMQRYGSKVMSAKDTVMARDACGIDSKTLQQKIKDYYNKIVEQFNVPKRSTRTKKSNVEIEQSVENEWATPVVSEVVPVCEDVEVVIENDKDTTTSEDEE